MCVCVYFLVDFVSSIEEKCKIIINNGICSLYDIRLYIYRMNVVALTENNNKKNNNNERTSTTTSKRLIFKYPLFNITHTHTHRIISLLHIIMKDWKTSFVLSRSPSLCYKDCAVIFIENAKPCK